MTADGYVGSLFFCLVEKSNRNDYFDIIDLFSLKMFNMTIFCSNFMMKMV